VELHFYKADIHTATLYLDVNQGIELSSNFTAELQKIDCISALNPN